MTPIKQALVIAAGEGRRLLSDGPMHKCLLSLGDRPLLRRLLDQLADEGIERVVLVVGFHADALVRIVSTWPLGLELVPLYNVHWMHKNGLSVLAAERALEAEPFLLSMADHVFEPAMLRLACGCDLPERGASLLVDFKTADIFDLADATKVRVEGRQICAIGKELTTFNAVDTGLFACSPHVFTALREAAARSGDCGLSEGMSRLAVARQLWARDIGGARWQDVDTPQMYQQARRTFC